MQEKDTPCKKVDTEKEEVKDKFVIENGCFVCHGTGHWARECTSLPSIYLTNDAPKCYRCGGIGHFARFCPTSEKQFRNRERRSSMPPSLSFSPADWPPAFYYNDQLLIPQMTSDQVVLVRPEYFQSTTEMSSPSFSSSTNDVDEIMSDCSGVDYIVEADDFKYEKISLENHAE